MNLSQELFSVIFNFVILLWPSFIRWHKMLLPDTSCQIWIQHFPTSSIWKFLISVPIIALFLLALGRRKFCLDQVFHFIFVFHFFLIFLWVWVPFINPLPSTFFFPTKSKFCLFCFLFEPNFTRSIPPSAPIFFKSLSLVYSCVKICTRKNIYVIY